MGGNRWFPAKIMNVNRDGTYDLRYDDGDEEAHVAPSFLRNFDSIYLTSKKESPTFSKHEKYVIDDPVEARYLGGGKWFPGKICSVNKDETYDVHYNDGEVESSLTSDLIRRIVQSALLEKASPPNSIHSKIVAHVHPVLVPLTVGFSVIFVCLFFRLLNFKFFIRRLYLAVQSTFNKTNQ